MTDQPDGSRDGHVQKRPVVVQLSEYRQERDPPPANTANGNSINISFNRRELDQILRIYGRMVGEGEWKDYAIDQLKDRAVFSVFKRSGEAPLFRIEKNPKLAGRQGAYSVINVNGMILKRGHDLPQVLKVFDKALKLIE